MTKLLTYHVALHTLLLYCFGIDYVTGNQYDMGRRWGDELNMPFYWGSACLVAAAAATLALVRKSAVLLKNVSLVAFGIYLMFAVQVADSRMLPVPWPPEDFRLAMTHVVLGLTWFGFAAAIWWRGGISKRKDQIIKGAEVADE